MRAPTSTSPSSKGSDEETLKKHLNISKKPCSRADRSTLIKAQVVRLAAERGTWDETEATHLRVHD